ncbi:hypothetical protein ARMGADRAFT_78752 [Armillaria gallica]|uniref:Uncharacterized protein n=1 Tax=Armillaria gallica TaxID=47427 RepID=A0A2H3CET2_ARMGA|nr:hypothetical protein ARMGADRAFT_78752 [Armillaria gallica]
MAILNKYLGNKVLLLILKGASLEAGTWPTCEEKGRLIEVLLRKITCLSCELHFSEMVVASKGRHQTTGGYEDTVILKAE